MRILIFLIPAIAAAVTVKTDFEGGSLGRVEKVSETHFRLGVNGEKDQDGRNRQANWYYFRVDGAGTKELTLDMVDLPGEYNYQPNQGAITKDTPPVISYDRRTWKHIDTFTYDRGEPKLTLRVIADAIAILDRSRSSLHFGGARPAARRRRFATPTSASRSSAKRRRPQTWCSGPSQRTPVAKDKADGLADVPPAQLGTGSSWVGEGAVRALLRDDTEARRLRQAIVWKIFPLCDPDGVARGGVRFNANGFDLNRNWDVDAPAKMPEIAAQRDAVRAWIRDGHTIALYFSLHNTETGEYLEGPPQKDGDGKFQPLAERFLNILTTETTFAPTTPLRYADITTTAGMTGRMTVVPGPLSRFQDPYFSDGAADLPEPQARPPSRDPRPAGIWRAVSRCDGEGRSKLTQTGVPFGSRIQRLVV